jgi:hypothetical protein
MLERIGAPEMPRRDILLDCRLVVRDSCGAPISASGSAALERAEPGKRDHSEAG